MDIKKLCLGLFAVLIAQISYASQTVLFFNSEPGDFIGQGQTELIKIDEADFRARTNFDNGISISINNFSRPDRERFIFFSADFSAPFNESLFVGPFENATRFPFQALEEPGLSFSGNGRGCNRLTGRFDVLEIEIDPITRQVNRFAVDFEQHCEGREPALFGSIRINSDIPVPTLLPPQIVLNEMLNTEGCVEATSAAGAVVNVQGLLQQGLNEDFLFEWMTGNGQRGQGDRFTFDVGLNQSETVTLSITELTTGEMNQASLDVCVSDTTAPTIEIISPLPGDVIVGNNLSVSVRITDQVDADIEQYQVLVSEQFFGQLDSNLESTLRLFKPDKNTASVKIITVNASDQSGNNAQSSVVVNVAHDNRK